jgi:hypothetical protein
VEIGLDVGGAADRVADDMGQDWVKDPIYRSDVLEAIYGDEEGVTRRIARGDPPRRGLPVPVPKSSIALRPAVDLRTIDRVAYQALVDTFAFEVLADLPESVSGWRFEDDPEGPGDLADQSLEWRTHQAVVAGALNQEPNYVLTADISNIPHDLLRDRVQNIDGLVRNAVFDYISIWHPRRIGVPQRVLASSLLANAFRPETLAGTWRSIR